MTARKLWGLVAVAAGMPAVAGAQVPDLLNAIDAGGRAMGVGGASRVTDSTTMSALDNPAGLAYINRPTVGVAFRNLPKVEITATGNFADRTTSSDETNGRFALSHAGYAFPMAGGTVGISYTVGGYADAHTTGANLANNALFVRNLNEQIRAQTDFFTVGYGRSASNGLNFGLGVVVASQYTKFSQSYQLFDGSNTQVGSSNTFASDNGMGIGAVFGIQGFSPDGALAWGASVRTPIDINGNDDTASVYDKIPGKLSVGIANRLNAYSAGGNFLVALAQIDYFFGGEESALLARRDYAAFGLGLEYSMNRYNARIPIRFGFQAIPSGGNGFDDRNMLTFGVGYRPNGKPLSIDLNFAKALDSGTFDIGLGVSYRPGN